MRYSNDPWESIAGFFRRHRVLSAFILIALLLFALLICYKVGEAHEADASSSYADTPKNDEEFTENFAYLSVQDFEKVTDSVGMIDVNLSETEGDYEISEGGDYHLFGTLDGQIYICAKEQFVHLYLDNVTVSSDSCSALYCEEAQHLTLTLMPETENLFSDSGDYRADTEQEGCIYSACDLTINGTGYLQVNGYYKDGIASRDILKILGGTCSVKCKRTGIIGNDGVLIGAGNITVSSEKYGVKTTKSGADGRGSLMILGGQMSIIAGRYAFVTTKADLYIDNCTIYTKSIVSDYDVAGYRHIKEGCVIR